MMVVVVDGKALGSQIQYSVFTQNPNLDSL